MIGLAPSRLVWRSMLVAAACLGVGISVVAAGDGSTTWDDPGCAGCHPRAADEFAASAMAGSASGADFVAERTRAGGSEACLACHAPRGGAGLSCEDCHRGEGHPEAAPAAPAACAPCHDAPGENTVRHFLVSPAVARGESCTDCHMPIVDGRRSHRFPGATTPGFLEGVARLRLVLRRDGESLSAVVQVRHRAGHNLPGGTTGRAVWLIVEGLKGLEGSGRASWQEHVRFGWERTPAGDWNDRTLPVGKGAIVEFERIEREEARLLRATLFYRFRPGPWARPDPREVVLDRIDMTIPRTVR